MAQLIKLNDFISRYETDIYRYPGQYIRLKKERWERIKEAWERNEDKEIESLIRTQKNEYPTLEGFEDFDETWLEGEKVGLLHRVRRWFKRPASYVEEDESPMTLYDLSEQTLDDVKRTFLDELFQFQINWASSTMQNRSVVDEDVYYDETLKYFLQHFPDNYLILYKPTLTIRKALVDLDIIIISPVATFCISLLESTSMSVFMTKRGRYWTENLAGQTVKRVNPILSLNRTERIVRGLYEYYNVPLPINKVMLSRTGFIEGYYNPYNTTMIDKRSYADWYKKMRRLSAPIKSVQLKGAKALLSCSQSTYAQRYEWESEIEFPTT